MAKWWNDIHAGFKSLWAQVRVGSNSTLATNPEADCVQKTCPNCSEVFETSKEKELEYCSEICWCEANE